MIDIIPLSVTSIKVVVPELNATLQDSSRNFETFMADRSQHEQLAESRKAISDVVGILKLLEIPGALALAEEMLLLLDKVAEQPEKVADFTLSALSHAFVAMPCYIEYIVDREQAMPALTLPFINELRSARRQPLVFESQLAEYSLPSAPDLAAEGDKAEDLPSLIGRLRQMYQIGLIGLIREENLQLKMQIMHRAMQRLAKAVGNAPIRSQWFLAEAVLEGLLSHDLSLGFTRKRTLSLIDGELRKFAQSPESADITAPDELLTELVYLINLSRCTHPASSEVTKRLSLKPLNITDKTLVQEQNIMQGPNADTISTMVGALRDELAQCKEQLEVAAQDNAGSVDFSQMAGVFQRTADILAVTGLTRASRVLFDMRDKVRAWGDGEQHDRDQLLDVADSLLYVESALSNLNRFDLNFSSDLDDEETKRALMAKSQLNEAEAIVVQEAQAGITQAKKDINSFIESQFDKSYLDNVLDILVTVKGGLTVLGLSQAAAVVNSGVKFIKATMDDTLDESSAQNVLETMADALIALEYYLSEMQLHGKVPDSVLAVAEQSLAALGYPVSGNQ